MSTKTNNEALVSIKGNKSSNINVNIGRTDKLSRDGIYDEKNNVLGLEDAFSERLEYGCDVLTKTQLPKELQEDFVIKPRIVQGNIDFYTAPKKEDSYKKHPLKLNFKMKFDSVKQAEEFRKFGLEELQRRANETNQPIRIPNITDMKEYLGIYENPISFTNKHGWDGSMLYIMPKELPPSEEFSIEVSNEKTIFKIITKLKLVENNNNKIVLSNQYSLDEPFEIKLLFTDINIDEKEILNGKFNIMILLREKYLKDCFNNLELIKYHFIIEDSNSILSIKKVKTNENIFNYKDCGQKVYKKRDYKKLDNTINLINNVIYISKAKKINVDYDIDYITKNAEYINMVIHELHGENYIINKPITWTIDVKHINEEELYRNNKKIALVTYFSHFALFDQEIELKKHQIILVDCEIISIDKKSDNISIKLKSNKLVFELDGNKKTIKNKKNIKLENDSND